MLVTSQLFLPVAESRQTQPMLMTVGFLWQTADGLIVDDLLPLGGCSTREGFVKRGDVHSLLRFRCLKRGIGANVDYGFRVL